MVFWGGSGDRTGQDARRSLGIDGIQLQWGERHVDVFKEGLGGDSFYAFRSLHEVVAGAAGLLAAESVGEDEWFGELTSAHQKTGAIDGPWALSVHKTFFNPRHAPMLVPGISGFRFLTEHGRRSANSLFQVE